MLIKQASPSAALQAHVRKSGVNMQACSCYRRKRRKLQPTEKRHTFMAAHLPVQHITQSADWPLRWFSNLPDTVRSLLLLLHWRWAVLFSFSFFFFTNAKYMSSAFLYKTNPIIAPTCGAPEPAHCITLPQLYSTIPVISCKNVRLLIFFFFF